MLGFVCLIFAALCGHGLSSNTTDWISANRTDIYVGVVVPLSNHWWAKYGRLLPLLLEDFLERLEERSDILSGYKLNFVVKDTQGDPGLAGRRLSELVTEPPTKLAIIGPVLSDEAVLVSPMTPWYNLVQMNFVARTSNLADRETNPSVYLTNYLEEQFNVPKIQLMNHFGWERAATLFEETDLFKWSVENFHILMEASNMTLVTSGVIVEKKEVSEQINRLKQYDARIIFGSFHSSTAQYVFCEAYKQGLYGRQYVWVLSGQSIYPNWMEKLRDDVHCTKHQLYLASNGFFTMDVVQFGPPDKVTISGRTSTEFATLLSDLAEDNGVYKSPNHAFAYDAAWALALALTDASQKLATLNITLTDFSYYNRTVHDALKTSLETISFQGVSGRVSYGSDGQRIGDTFLKHHLDNKTTTLAWTYPGRDEYTWLVDESSIWEGNHVPKDRFEYVKAYPGLSKATAIAMVTLSTLGLMLSLGFLVFNISYRNIRLLMVSFAMFGFVTEPRKAYVRQDGVTHTSHELLTYTIRIWVMSLAFTLSFGAIFSKTWRVHILFRSAELRKKTLRDYKLFGLVVLFSLIDLLILLPWTLLHPLRERHEEHTQKVLADGDVYATETYVICYNEKQIYWLSATYIYKGLLLAFGTFLAWETRHVRIPALNDSREIGFCVYNVVVICLFGVPIYHLLSVNQSNLRFALSSAFIIFCTSLVLSIVFIPKILRRHDSGKPNVFMTMDGTLKSRTITGNLCTGSTEPNISRSSKVAPEASGTLSPTDLNSAVSGDGVEIGDNRVYKLQPR